VGRKPASPATQVFVCFGVGKDNTDGLQRVWIANTLAPDYSNIKTLAQSACDEAEGAIESSLGTVFEFSITVMTTISRAGFKIVENVEMSSNRFITARIPATAEKH